MRIPAPLPEPLNSLPFHVREAEAHGVPQARLRRADLVTPFRGVRSSRPLVTMDEVCMAYLPLLRDTQWFSHCSAAALWGMWLPRRLRAEQHVHVSAAWPAREPRMRGVVGHRVDPSSVSPTLLRGMPIASAADAWCLLSTELSVHELVIAGDSMVRRQGALGTLDDLSRALTDYGRRRGAARLARALPQVRPGADSARESALRLMLMQAGLPEPMVNLKITDAQGRMFGDLGYPEWDVIVEYDGAHHLGARQNAADILRWERLTAAGWTVVRVVKDHLETPDDVVRRVARALVAGGWRPPRSKLHLLR